MEAKSTHITRIQYRLSINFYTKRMSSIINDLQTIFVCNILNSLHVAGFTIDMNRHDGSCFWSYCSLYLIGIKTACFPINIDKYGFYTIPPKGMGGCHETVGGSYYLTSNS